MTAADSAPENAAAAVKALVGANRLGEARARYAEVVERHQRRASRIALHYLRDAADADEAVQDAFVKAFTHIGSYKDEWPFEVWFTRILINGCLDRLKARRRRDRWIVPMIDPSTGDRDVSSLMPSRDMGPVVGFKPTIPFADDGPRTELAVSVPRPNWANAAAMAAPVPPLEPDGP